MTAKQDESRFLADRYRQAAFDLLRAAKVLCDTGVALRASRQKVADTAVIDLRAAMEILDAMPQMVPATKANPS